jgi:hypothetical protein
MSQNQKKEVCGEGNALLHSHVRRVDENLDMVFSHITSLYRKITHLEELIKLLNEKHDLLKERFEYNEKM